MINWRVLPSISFIGTSFVEASLNASENMARKTSEHELRIIRCAGIRMSPVKDKLLF